MLRSFVSLIIVIGVLVAAPTSAQVRMVEEANWPPFTPKGFGPTEQGLSYDLMAELFGRLGLELRLELFPMSRVLVMLERGEADGATVISRNRDRSRFLVFSEPIFQKRGLVYRDVTRLPDFTWAGFADLKPYRIGTVRGNNYGDAFEEARRDLALEVFQSGAIDSAMMMLERGRLDVVLSIERSGVAVLRQLNLEDRIQAAARPYFVKDYHVGIAKRSPLAARMTEINTVIRGMKADGTLQAILRRSEADTRRSVAGGAS